MRYRLNRMVAKAGPASPICRCQGFTLAELLVASVVMSTALLGVYSLFSNAITMEATATIRWEDRAAAELAVEHVAQAIESAVNLSNLSTFRAEACATGGRSLTCQLPLERRRYVWQIDGQDGPVRVDLQRRAFAGTADLSRSPVAADAPELPDGQEEDWSDVSSTMLATGMKTFTIRFSELDEARLDWKDDWKGPSGRVVVWIQATVGQQVAERVVVPAVSAKTGG